MRFAHLTAFLISSISKGAKGRLTIAHLVNHALLLAVQVRRGLNLLLLLVKRNARCAPNNLSWLAVTLLALSRLDLASLLLLMLLLAT